MKFDFKPKKFLGQVFLKDRKTLSLIAKSLEIKPGDVILEIGAGSGNLTEAVLKEFEKKPGGIFAFEKDKKLIDILRKKFEKEEKIKIVAGDIRKIGLDKFLKENKVNKIVGNLPYYLSGLFLRRLLDLREYPEIVVLMLQKEVAQKILSFEANFFSLSFSLVAKIKKISLVKKDKFFPKPKVDSIIIKINFSEEAPEFSFRQQFFSFLKKGFSFPRKTLFSNLKSSFNEEKLEEIFKKLCLDKRLRPHQLSLKNYLEIFSYFSSSIAP